jgi:hypothetical protein
VCSRYLQTQAAKPIPTLQLSVVLMAVAWAGCIVFYTIPSTALTLAAAARQHWHQRQASKSTAVQDPMQPTCVSVTVETPAVVQTGSAPGAKAAAAAAPAAAMPCSSSADSSWRSELAQRFKSWAVAALIGGLVAAQALTLIYASRFTVAYMVQVRRLLTLHQTRINTFVIVAAHHLPATRHSSYCFC